MDHQDLIEALAKFAVLLDEKMEKSGKKEEPYTSCLDAIVLAHKPKPRLQTWDEYQASLIVGRQREEEEPTSWPNPDEIPF